MRSGSCLTPCLKTAARSPTSVFSRVCIRSCITLLLNDPLALPVMNSTEILVKISVLCRLNLSLPPPLCVSMFVYRYTYKHVCVCMWRSEDSLGCRSSRSLHHFFFEFWSLIGLKLHPVGCSRWPALSRDSPMSPSHLTNAKVTLQVLGIWIQVPVLVMKAIY